MGTTTDPVRLAIESWRIRHAALFDPRLAVHVARVDPLPHQVSAVYETLLAQRPLRFVLADDPGAGKTIMAGLLITEMRARGLLRNCVVVAPGSLVDQWRDELWTRFDLRFDLPTRADLTRADEWFVEHPFAVVRLDQVARDPAFVARVAAVHWDLAVFDEAHRLSTGWNGQRLDPTQRFSFARRVAAEARDVLLMSATPHDGSEERFQAFLQLVDGDRFAGKFRDGVHTPRIDDLIHRRLKEDLVRFDGSALFPPRHAVTVNFALSPREKSLYESVTQYVRTEFDRAEATEGRGRTVGFALTVLQRRLASSPSAIHRSLSSRRAKLAARLAALRARSFRAEEESLSDDELESALDLPGAETEAEESALAEGATAARSIDELADEVERLVELEVESRALLQAKVDCKRERVADLLTSAAMVDLRGQRRKLVVFTEHRDTLTYVADFLANLRGRAECVVTIDGSMDRAQRLAAQRAFADEEGTEFLVATDAAGEGINLQCASLVLNWDIPWSPARIEQRFGRVHRIGQTETCQLWNLVADGTRETEVFQALCRRLEEESKSLRGQVFDVLGAAFSERPLRDFLLDAVRGGRHEAARAGDAVGRQVDEAVTRQHEFSRRVDETAAREAAARQLRALRDDMDRAAGQQLGRACLEPWFVAALGSIQGRAFPRSEGRYAVNFTPPAWRAQDATLPQRPPPIGFDPHAGDEVLRLTVAHPWARALALAVARDALPSPAVYVDPFDGGSEPWWLVAVSQALTHGEDARLDEAAWLVAVRADGSVRPLAGPAHLDLRPATDEERARLAAMDPALPAPPDSLRAAIDEALLAPWRRAVRTRHEKAIDVIEREVMARLSAETQQAHRLKVEAQARGHHGAKKAQQQSELEKTLRGRMFERRAELAGLRAVADGDVEIVAVVPVVPAGLVGGLALDGGRDEAAIAAVMRAEALRGRDLRDVRTQRPGWDLEARDPATGALRFWVVRGVPEGAASVTLRRSEAMALRHAPERVALVVVEVDDEGTTGVPVVLDGLAGAMPGFEETGVVVALG